MSYQPLANAFIQYGGFYGPAFFSYFEEQNKLIKKKKPSLPNATFLNLGTLGIVDGCIDARVMAKGYPQTAYNNTYGIQAYSKEVYDQAMADIEAPGEGCYALIDACRKEAKKEDPEGFGNNPAVNGACLQAMDKCFNQVQGAFSAYSNVSQNLVECY